MSDDALNIDVEPTAEAMDEIANTMEHFASNIRRLAKSMRERGDLTYAAEALQEVKNCMGNVRIDLLTTRPQRELMRVISKLQPEN